MKKEKRKNICLTLLTDNIDSFDVIKIIFPSYGRNFTRILHVPKYLCPSLFLVFFTETTTRRLYI